MLDVGFGCWCLDFSCWVLDGGFWVLDVGWFDCGFRIVDVGFVESLLSHCWVSCVQILSCLSHV